MTSRVKNYFWHRENPDSTIEWVRGDQVSEMVLPKPLVLVSGVWEFLHCGEMRMLFAAREKAGPRGTVVAAVASDRWAAEALGHGRPIMRFIERTAALEYMPVDLIVEVDSLVELYALGKLADLVVTTPMDKSEFLIDSPRLRRMFMRASGMTSAEIIRRVKNVSNM
jgi:glycerol-3-phosphate cytidylyltransferase-like family protein